MKLYNSETRTIEEFVPRNGKEVTMYTCGPTVYNFAHIGNLRSYIMEDVLQKSLEYLGYNVKRVMNITDVGHLTDDADAGEDKMLVGAEGEHKTVMEIAQFYTQAFKYDCAKLNIKWPEYVVPATSCINDYIHIIETLMNKGYAYKSGDNVYFDTSKLDNYYRLTNQGSDDLAVGVREGVDEDEHKRNKNDFVLWFTKSKFANHALKWDSPWGVGYPGWHIECSGISNKYCGEYLDIHCGGIDNKFPHHTNEIAQTESYVGHKWCNYWFHVEHLTAKNGKMSKSSGGATTLTALIDTGVNPLAYRFFCLQSHYRRQLCYTVEGIESANLAYNKLLNRVAKLDKTGEVDKEAFDAFDSKFKECLSNDINTSSAVTCVFDVLKADINDATKYALINSFDRVLGLDLTKAEDKKTADSNVDETYILDMIEKRKQAKANKDYETADAIRAELAGKGIELVDTKEGTTYTIKK